MPDFGIMRGFGSKLFSDKLVAGQLPTQLGLIGSVDFGFDPDAQAFFNRVTTAGGTLSATEKLAVDTLVKQMKLDGIWTKMKTIYPMVGASAAACAQNLKSSSFTGTFTSGWTFASTGVTGNGTSAYMDSGLTPSPNLSISSAHLSVYINTNPDSNNRIFWGGGNLSEFMQAFGGTFYGSLATSAYSNITTTTLAAFYMINRPNITNQKLIKNNSILLDDLQTAISYSSTQNMLLNAYTTTTFINNCQFAFASIGDGLTDTQASNFYTAVQAFQTTLSRQV